MLKLDNFQIITPKHPVEGVTLYSWCLYESWKYGIELQSHYHFKSIEEAKKNWEEFATLNNLSNWKYYSDNRRIEIRTDNGTFI